MKNKKIKIQKDLIKIVRNLKRRGKKIVTFSGSFDILHNGHIKSLNEAKSQGDILIILLNSDESVRSYKGPTRPINSQKNRAEILAALECVDYVTIFNEINPKEILNKLGPNIHCNGPDWGKDCIEKAVVENHGGKIYITKLTKYLSTSNLIKKILEVYSEPPTKAIFLDRDGTINLSKQGYIHKIEDFEFFSDVIQALRKLSKTDYKIIIITNQSGIGRGYFEKEDVEKLHRWLVQFLKKKGARIDKIYYCPHLPDKECLCRKPKIGMLMQAVKDFGISLNDSWIIGDAERDVIMGKEANVNTIKIGKKLPRSLKLQPNYHANNLKKAVDIILQA